MDARSLWRRYRDTLCECPNVGMTLDISRMAFEDGFLADMEPSMQRAYDAMAELERGAVANPDEGRRVGHYWLRDPETAPETALSRAVEETVTAVEAFAAEVHNGIRRTGRDAVFTDFLVVGIGGSTLGPQWVADALGHPATDRLSPHFLDNTDPQGFDKVLAGLGANLATTLVVVISKSGGTPETRNGMLAVKDAFRRADLDFAPHAVAITGEGSKLDTVATDEGWAARFPMWDWVGGRTSETSAVGLLPAALQGLDIRALLAGARDADNLTRRRDTASNPAALLALMWFHATGGKGERDMVVLPYRDSLLLFSRYLQQLVMESLGKDRDLDGAEISQGIAVYGNKGSTDQHAYVQQLREGIDNFFVTFIAVLDDGDTPSAALEVEPGVTAGDYLRGFLLGTRRALTEAGRLSMTLTLDRLDAHRLGALIALYERAVGFYASLIHINAYHQPGVEAGKKAAATVLDLQRRVLAALGDTPRAFDNLVDEVAPEDPETVHLLLTALAANGRAQKRDDGWLR